LSKSKRRRLAKKKAKVKKEEEFNALFDDIEGVAPPTQFIQSVNDYNKKGTQLVHQFGEIAIKAGTKAFVLHLTHHMDQPYVDEFGFFKNKDDYFLNVAVSDPIKDLVVIELLGQDSDGFNFDSDLTFLLFALYKNNSKLTLSGKLATLMSAVNFFMTRSSEKTYKTFVHVLSVQLVKVMPDFMQSFM
jgi:hypothetical protein